MFIEVMTQQERETMESNIVARAERLYQKELDVEVGCSKDQFALAYKLGYLDGVDHATEAAEFVEERKRKHKEEYLTLAKMRAMGM